MQAKVLTHPVIGEYLAIARDSRTDKEEFYEAIRELGRYAAYELARSMPPKTRRVETPLGAAKGTELAGRADIVVVLVLRAAIPFVEGVREVFRDARVGVVSAWRGKAPRHEVEVVYCKLPRIRRTDTVVIADPMLATGHTLVEVARRVTAGARPARLVFLSVIATKKGMRLVERSHPEGEFYTCAVDPGLDSRGYIIPGLGDAGDRALGEPY